MWFAINNVSVIQMRYKKWFINPRGENLQIIFWWLQSSCNLIRFTLNMLIKCLWVEQVTTFALLNFALREFLLIDFFEKYTSCVCLLGSGLNYIFHWKVQLLIACKSLFNTLCNFYLWETREKRDVLSGRLNVVR